MKILPTALAGVLIIEPDVFSDERGFFLETYHRERYAEFGIDVEFVQHNHSRSTRDVLRGLHLQRTKPQAKLVRAASGCIWDVAVDVIPSSKTFRRWVGIELSATNHRQLFIPAGYAHGFCVLSEAADVEYKCTRYYARDNEAGIAWNDADLAIDWPVASPRLSERDRHNPTLGAFLSEVP